MLAPARMPVQWVCRPEPTFRGFAGLIAAGTLKPGDAMKVLPSARKAIAADRHHGRRPRSAVAGQSVMLTLADEIDASRGSVIVHADAPVEVADQFEVQVLWMGDEDAARPAYLIKLGTRTVHRQTATPKYEVNVNTLEHTAARRWRSTRSASATSRSTNRCPLHPTRRDRNLGGFIIIDRFTNNTVGLGLIHFALRRASNIHWQALDVNKATRAPSKNQKSTVLWFTGLSGSGKSTVANIVEKRLTAMGHHTYLLDGDNVRHGLNRDLGFTDADRVENIRRVSKWPG
jgi:bifunctional enzyme CysN/CysC